MNWDAIGAIAEMVGAIGVIASLTYLAIQLRQSSRTDQSSAFVNLMSALNDHLGCMLQPENLPIVVIGLNDFGSLSGAEKIKFDHLMIGLLNLGESVAFSSDILNNEDETMDNWGYILRTRYLPYRGMLDWWEGAKYAYSPDMQTWVQLEIDKTDMSSDFWGIK